MKKIVSIIFFIILLISLMPTEYIEAANDKKVGKVYANIIENYLESYETAKNGSWEQVAGVNDEFSLASSYSDNKVVYKITDYNHDRKPELFIGLYSRSGYGTIYDVYTFYKGKAVQLMTDIGYHAGTCQLCKNGIIKNISAGTAFYAKTIFHKLPKGGKKLKNIVALEWKRNYDTDEETYIKNVNGESIKISKQKYEKLVRKYGRLIKTTFYKVDRKAIENIRKGNFKYKNQTKWKFKTNWSAD